MKSIELLPRSPGVYFFRNSENNIIYIGKATCLRDRVRSYFAKSNTTLKNVLLLEEYAAVDYIGTKTETEASLLEAHMIHEHQPKFNVLLKTGQPFLYILFTKNDFPQMEITRNKKKKGTYFGPFLHKQQARSVFNFLTRTFRLKTCNTKIESGCLGYHIGNCAGNCKSDFDKENYLLRLSLAKDILKAHHKSYTKKIKNQMEIYIKDLAFEKAQHLHEYLNSFDAISQTLRIKFSPSKYNTDIFLALNPFEPPLEHNLTQLKDPIKDLTKFDAEIDKQLQQFLNLKKPVETIDCFDISHFQSQSLVGSCVRFTHGQPDKNNFRRFMIKTLTQQNDYAALQEIVARRYKNKEEIPDLILIDGGKGQLNAIKNLVPETTVLSLAKREETLFGPQFPEGIKLDVKTPVGKLFMALRDYAHHFAIDYHRLKTRKKLKEI